jgi:Domain of unknown function (DUF4160)
MRAAVEKKIDRIVETLQLAYQEMVKPDQDQHGPFLHLVLHRSGKLRIEVRMERNHPRPHFHAICTDACNVSVDIMTTERLVGDCSPRIWKEVRSWAFLNRDRLLTVWNHLNSGQLRSFPMEA